MKFYYVTNIFDLHTVDNETTMFGPFYFFFLISTEMHSASLFFLNERKIETSLLMIHLKCNVEHYANLSPSCINKSY